tara:strand:- start:71 stop:493 length:423 start_codon:yes stop_codon:yes gene_type:complete
MSLLITYDKYKKKTGKPIKTISGNTVNYTDMIQGVGDLTMSYNPELKQNELIKKVCVMEISNHVEQEIKGEIKTRLWFCKGNFSRSGLENTPIVKSNNIGKDRENLNTITLKNTKFRVMFGNALPIEKRSGATTIVEIYQ